MLSNASKRTKYTCFLQTQCALYVAGLLVLTPNRGIESRTFLIGQTQQFSRLMFCIISTLYSRDRRESAKSRKPTKAQYTVDGIIYASLSSSRVHGKTCAFYIIFYGTRRVNFPCMHLRRASPNRCKILKHYTHTYIYAPRSPSHGDSNVRSRRQSARSGGSCGCIVVVVTSPV